MKLKVNKNNGSSGQEDECFQYGGKYRIKELFLKRIKMDPFNTKIESLNDLSNIMIAYARYVPYDNTDAFFDEMKTISVEYSIQRILIENKGSNCICLNLLFGTFLFEMGIGVRLVASIFGSKQINNPWFQYHMANIIEWKEKVYFVDCGLCAITPYKPIEIGNLQLIYNDKIPNRGYRVRQLPDTLEYVYEYIQDCKDKFNIVFHFTFNPVDFKIFDKCLTGFKNAGIDNLMVYKLFKYGHYYLFKTLFIIQYFQILNKCKNNCCIGDSFCLNESYPVFPLSSTKTKILNLDHFKQISKSIFYKNDLIASKL